MVEYRTGSGDALFLKAPGVLEVFFRHLQRNVGTGPGQHATIGDAAAGNARSLGCPDWLATKIGQRMQRAFDETRSGLPTDAEINKTVSAARALLAKQQDEENSKRIAAATRLVMADKAKGLI